jgi:tetratricopeptide (TPR) repeat protein
MLLCPVPALVVTQDALDPVALAAPLLAELKPLIAAVRPASERSRLWIRVARAEASRKSADGAAQALEKAVATARKAAAREENPGFVALIRAAEAVMESGDRETGLLLIAEAKARAATLPTPADRFAAGTTVALLLADQGDAAAAKAALEQAIDAAPELAASDTGKERIGVVRAALAPGAGPTPAAPPTPLDEALAALSTGSSEPLLELVRTADTDTDDAVRALGALTAFQAQRGDAAGVQASLADARRRIATTGRRAALLSRLIEALLTGGKQAW